MELIDLIVGYLPPLQQQIFRMKEIEGYEKEEIMLVTGCSNESLRQLPTFFRAMDMSAAARWWRCTTLTCGDMS